MKKDENYFNENEVKDFELMSQFNDRLNLIDLGQTPAKWYYDASGKTMFDKYVEIELKNRNR